MYHVTVETIDTLTHTGFEVSFRIAYNVVNESHMTKTKNDIYHMLMIDYKAPKEYDLVSIVNDRDCYPTFIKSIGFYYEKKVDDIANRILNQL